jgi:hypothetical protein
MGYIIKSSGIIESGSYNPLIALELSACRGISLTRAYYTRVNNIVSCTIFGNGNFDFALDFSGIIDFDIPIPTTTLLPIGLGQISGNPSNTNIACFNSSSGNCRYFFSSNSLTNFNAGFTLSFQYEIN